LPEVGNTTPDPAYPGAHAVISAAGGLGRDVADFVLDHVLVRRHQEDEDGDAR
jgi:hypothetical protein